MKPEGSRIEIFTSERKLKESNKNEMLSTWIHGLIWQQLIHLIYKQKFRRHFTRTTIYLLINSCVSVMSKS